MGISGLLTTAFVVGLSGAMAPGSLLVVVVTETVRKGFWAGPVAVMGHAVTELAMVSLLALGLGRVLSHGAALGVIGLTGGVMLFWFGCGTWKAARGASLDFDKQAAAAKEPSGSAMRHTALAGMAASISNPYWILWWATIGTAYVASGMASNGLLGAGTFLVGHLASDTVWYVFVSLAISTGARFLNDRVYRGILYVCGAFLFLFGAYFLKVGMGFVLGK